MSKITKRPARKPYQAAPATNDLDLRRWCIEQALKWPQDFGRSYAPSGAYPPIPTAMQEANVIGRATAILTWVTSSK